MTASVLIVACTLLLRLAFATSSAVANAMPVDGAARPPASTSVPTDEAARRDQAIDAMRGHLIRSVRPDGWFVYGLDGQGAPLSGYNIVRHAGTMLAMSQALQQRPGDLRLRDALAAAAQRLLDCCVSPVHVAPPADDAGTESRSESEMGPLAKEGARAGPSVRATDAAALAVWWPSGYESGDSVGLASLGAAALGLIALIAADRHDAHAVPIETLRGFGHFLLRMQRSDGSFRSRWFGDGRDDDWRSLYYPGEAALALLWLAWIETDPAQASRWWRGARDALLALADERRSHEPTPPDHWALIATGALACGKPALPRGEHDALTLHAWQIAQGMIAEQAGLERFSGGFVDDERITPTATRLEGLLALHAWPLPDEARAQLAGVTGRGLAWLLASIPVNGPRAGAVPRHRGPTRGATYARHAESRIDYTQHALSAMLMARRLGQGDDVCALLLPPDRAPAAPAPPAPEAATEQNRGFRNVGRE